MRYRQSIFHIEDERAVPIKAFIPVLFIRAVVISCSFFLAYRDLFSTPISVLYVWGNWATEKATGLESTLLGAYFGGSAGANLAIALISLAGGIALLSRWKWACHAAIVSDALVIGLFGFEITQRFFVYSLAPLSFILLWPYLVDGFYISLKLSTAALGKAFALFGVSLAVGIMILPLNFWFKVQRANSVLDEAGSYLHIPDLYPGRWQMDVDPVSGASIKSRDCFYYVFEPRLQKSGQIIILSVHRGEDGRRLGFPKSYQTRLPAIEWHNVPYDFPETRQQAVSLVQRFETYDHSEGKFEYTGSETKDDQVVKWIFKRGVSSTLAVEKQDDRTRNTTFKLFIYR